MNFHIIYIALLSFCLPAMAGEKYHNATFMGSIKTLQVLGDGNIDNAAVIGLNSEQSLTIGFDELSAEMSWISYRIIHLNADWSASEVSELEYLEGFNNNQLEDPAQPSFNTYVSYHHYNLTLPNENVNFKISGNYAVEFYKDEQPDKVIATAVFSVSENMVGISAQVTGNTDIGFNRGYQQLSVDLNTKDMRINSPVTEVFLTIRQNHRADTEQRITSPMSFTSKEIRYEHNRQMIFEGGNNFRRFEITDTRYPGIGVDMMRYFEPFYHALLITDKRKSGSSYFGDRHQYGRFLITAENCENPDWEADYVMVHFNLDYKDSFIEGGLFVNGEFNNYAYNQDSKMSYDMEKGVYQQMILLKQGAYNFQYLQKKDRNTPGSTSLIEGNYYETDNIYTIMVYYRPAGLRYDRLLGTMDINSRGSYK